MATIQDVRTCKTLGWTNRNIKKHCTVSLLSSRLTLTHSFQQQNSLHTGTNNIFIFGYIVGENNFVGEWRVAASDPLTPTWGNAFVMSRRAGTDRAGAGARVSSQAPATGAG